MTDFSPDSPTKEQRLERVLAEYLGKLDAGESVDRESILSRHPDLRSDLESFFRNREAIERIAEPLRAGSTADEPTLGLGEHVDVDPRRVRYFGDYELIDEIARGGMGVVYKARQQSLNRPVALKMILAGQLASGTDVERFRQEAEHAANLDHPHIVPIYEIGMHQGRHYFSMKLIEGSNLRTELPHLRENLREGIKLLTQVARAVHHAHQRGVLHRDLKPGNVLIDGNRVPHVTDFGLAKRVEGDSHLTQSGAIVGTPGYMAPEQASGEKQLSTAVDVYSLGAMLYELLVGRPPFQGATPMETLVQVVSQEPQRPGALAGNVDADLETIALKCLEKDPGRRYDSAAALADDLERWLRGEPIVARPVGKYERTWRWCKRNPVVAGLAAMTVISLCTGMGLSAYLANEAMRHARQAEQARKTADENARHALQQQSLAETSAAEAKTNAEQARRETARANQGEELALRRLYDARMNLVQAAWDDARLGEVRRLLASPPAGEPNPLDPRGWEWHYWNRLSQTELQSWPIPEGNFSSFAISPKNGQLTSAAGTLGIILDVRAGFASSPPKPVFTRISGADRHSQYVRVAYSHDGKWLAVTRVGNRFSNKDKQVEFVPGSTSLWDVKGNRFIRTFPHPGNAYIAAFSPDDRYLAVGGTIEDGGPGAVRVWDLSSRSEATTLQGKLRDPRSTPSASQESLCVHTGRVVGLAFRPDGKQMVTTAADQTAKVWDLQTGAELRTLQAHEAMVTAAVFSPDGVQLATCGADNVVKLWKSDSGELLHTLRGHRDVVNCVAFASDGKTLVSASSDRTIRLWDPRAGIELGVLKGHSGGVTHLAFDADGQLFSSGYDGVIKSWKLQGAQELQPLKFSGIAGWSNIPLAFASDGQSLFAAASAVKVWNLRKPGEEKSLSSDAEYAQTPVFSRDCKWIAAADSRHVIRVWEAEAGREHCLLAGHKDFIRDKVFSPDGKLLASTSQDRDLRVWDLATAQSTVLKTPSRSTSLAFSADGRYLAAAESHLMVWDLQTQSPVFDVSTKLNLLFVAFSPDGKRLATGDTSDVVRIWDAASGQQLSQFAGHIGNVECGVFSPRGDRLATGGGLFDQSIKVWDMATGQEVITLDGHSKPLAGLAFSHDGYDLASIDSDGHIRIWSAKRD